ncbi:asparaginyl-tRNA synthetase [Ceratobasidium sp. AG-Ba]|nr:asparaginyl-tRNA synthetase [Ceratobasidium sp. AG-Ba]
MLARCRPQLRGSWIRYLNNPSISRGLLPTIGQILTSPPSPDVETTITAFVKSIRKQKHVAFADISDGSSPLSLQAVIEPERVGPELIQRVTSGASVKLTGKLVESLGSGQAYDLRVEQLEILGTCDPAAYPLQKKTHTHEHLRANSHLRPRTEETAAVMRTRALLTRAISEYFDSQQFVQVHTPVITSNDTEGAGETFRVMPALDNTDLPDASNTTTETDSGVRSEFFGVTAHLSVSAQLHLEALSHALSRVYTLAPAFRAERSQTNRHLAEFWMLEAEMQMAAPSMTQLLDVVEASLRHVLDAYTKSLDSKLRFGETKSAQAALDQPWRRMSYTEALMELEAAHDEGAFVKTTGKGKGKDIVPRPEWGLGLRSEHERYLARDAPVFVTDYPAKIKPFYMRANNVDSERQTVSCFDLLVPGIGELAGGSVREERIERLDLALKEAGLDMEEFRWYRDLRIYGGAPHAGFGLGFERLVSFVSGLENVRECIAFPRTFGRMGI